MRRALRKTLHSLLLAIVLSTISFSVPAHAQAHFTASGLPAEIPEPLTLVLFGTGLAALAAAVAVRRR